MDTTIHVSDAGTLPAETKQAPDLRETVARVQREARNVLGGHSGGLSHRLILTLSVIILLTVGVALYAAVACVAMAGEIAYGAEPWIDAVANTLLVALALGLFMPLSVSLERLSCLMAAPDGEVVHGMAVSVPTASLPELFYPFSSFRAYGRTMAVGMESLGFLLVGAGLPTLVGRLVWLSAVAGGMTPWLLGLSMTGIVVLGLCWGFGILLLSGRRMGFAYFVFVHEELSLGDANRLYRSHRRPLLPVLFLRMRLLGLYALSVAGIGVPFVFHSIPLGGCCKAVYSRDLVRR